VQLKPSDEEHLRHSEDVVKLFLELVPSLEHLPTSLNISAFFQNGLVDFFFHLHPFE
jgi:hypothetical protein